MGIKSWNYFFIKVKISSNVSIVKSHTKNIDIDSDRLFQLLIKFFYE